MKLRSNSFRLLFSGLCAAAFVVADAPVLLAAEEEAPASDPVWVLSYAAFIFFAGAVIMLGMIFSKNRRETLLDMAEQKEVAQIRADRATQRRKELQRAKMAAAKGKR